MITPPSYALPSFTHLRGTRSRARQRHVRIRVRRLCCPIGDVVWTNLLRPRRDVKHIDRAIENRKRRDRLIERHFVPALVDAGEGEVPVLARLAVLDSVDQHWGITRSVELGLVGVVRGETDRLAAEPVADVVGVAVDEGDADGGVEDRLQVVDEVRVDEVAGLLEGVVNLAIGVLSVVCVDAEGGLGGRQVEEVLEVGGRGGVFVRVADVVDAAARVRVVGAFDVVAAHVLRFGADCLVGERGSVGLIAVADLIQTAVGHGKCKILIGIDRVVDCFDSIGVVVGHDRVVGGLDHLVNNAVDYAERVEVKEFAFVGAVGNLFILLVEVVEEGWAIVASVRLGKEIELC